MLPRFSGTEVVCGKCGQSDIHTRLCDQPWGFGGARPPYCAKGEHLHRHCRTCGYEWLERPLDWIEPGDGQ
jgi:hypothetical protein